MDPNKICQWRDDYAVHVPVLDNHHQKLFDLVNDIFLLMRDGADDKPIIRVIDELLEYTDYHFREEERVMREVKFPEQEMHKKMHQDFVQTVVDCHSKSHNGMAIFVATKVSLTGLDWLKLHIMGADKKYYEFMDKHGMKLDDHG